MSVRHPSHALKGGWLPQTITYGLVSVLVKNADEDAKLQNLIDSGLNLNALDESGDSLLHLAVRQGGAAASTATLERFLAG